MTPRVVVDDDEFDVSLRALQKLSAAVSVFRFLCLLRLPLNLLDAHRVSINVQVREPFRPHNAWFVDLTPLVRVHGAHVEHDVFERVSPARHRPRSQVRRRRRLARLFERDRHISRAYLPFDEPIAQRARRRGSHRRVRRRAQILASRRAARAERPHRYHLEIALPDRLHVRARARRLRRKLARAPPSLAFSPTLLASASRVGVARAQSPFRRAPSRRQFLVHRHAHVVRRPERIERERHLGRVATVDARARSNVGERRQHPRGRAASRCVIVVPSRGFRAREGAGGADREPEPRAAKCFARAGARSRDRAHGARACGDASAAVG